MAATHRTVAGTCVVLALLCALASTAHAAFPGQNGKLAFQECPFRCGISTIDQSGVTKVTVGGVFGPIGSQVIVNDALPAWSADGEWIAFQRNERPASSPFSVSTISVMRHDGTQRRAITDLGNGALTSISWSPDGDELAYTRTGAPGIWIVNVAGPPAPRVIYPTSQAAYDANHSTYIAAQEVAWSPSGSQIAFSYAKGETTKGIGLLPPDADGAEDLAAVTTLPWAKPGGGCCNRSTHGEATWSPDGSRLAFVHGELDATINEGTSRIETIDPGGSDPAVVRDYPTGDEDAASFTSEPVWSPDGDWILWKLTADTTAKWEGAHPDGSERGDVPILGGQVDWQPCSTGCNSLYPGWEPPPPPSVTIGDATVAEGNTGHATATFTVTRAGSAFALSTPSRVGVGVGPGSAVLGQDVVGRGGTVEFDAGETTAQLEVQVVGDTVDEADETFVVDLFAQANATIADGRATGTITDDDPSPSVAIDDATVTEGGTATLTATLSAASGRVVTVSYATAPGTASANTDFLEASGTLTFSVGATSQTVAVTTAADGADEPAESFTLTLSAPNGATIADGQAQIMILDDDVATPPGPGGGNPPGLPPGGGGPPAGSGDGDPGDPGPAAFTAAKAIKLPRATGCVRRTLTLRVREPDGVDVIRVVVKVGKRKPLTRRGDDAVGTTTVRHLPRGRFKVRVRVIATDGRVVTASARYRSCARRRP